MLHARLNVATQTDTYLSDKKGRLSLLTPCQEEDKLGIDGMLSTLLNASRQ